MNRFMNYIFFNVILIFLPILPQNTEMIYAIMITGKDAYHEPLAQNAVCSFLEQTYPHKHLIIINDGDYTLNYEYEEITEIKLERKHTLGTLRNIGLAELPEESVWIQWDDDDWHHPKLMEEQYQYFLQQKAEMCLLRNQIQYAFIKNSSWVLSLAHGIAGTMMCRKKKDIHYQPVSKGEDTQFYCAYKNSFKVVIWDNLDFYYIRFIHGKNSWDNSHFNLNTKVNGIWVIYMLAKNYLSNVLNLYSFVDTK